MEDTQAQWFIDRMDFAGMLGDCLEVIVRAVRGEVIDEIDGESGAATWREGTPEQCVAEALSAYEHVAVQAIELCASCNAIEGVFNPFAGGLKGQWVKYCDSHSAHVGELYGRYDARKVAFDVKLGLGILEGDSTDGK